MVTTETWGRRALFQNERWAKAVDRYAISLSWAGGARRERCVEPFFAYTKDRIRLAVKAVHWRRLSRVAGGGFRFKKSKTGSFWLVTYVDGQDYKMPIRLQPVHPSTCSEQWFDIEKSGRFAFGVTITFD